MKLIAVMLIAQVWMNVKGQHLVLSSERFKEAIGCKGSGIYSQKISCHCSPGKVRIITLRQLYHKCTQNMYNTQSCCPGTTNYNYNSHISCEDDIYKYDKGKHQHFVQLCSNNIYCDVPVNQTQNASASCKQQGYTYSNRIAVKYTCAEDYNILHFYSTNAVTKNLSYGFIETRDYPNHQDSTNCWCRLSSHSLINKLMVIQANNTQMQFYFSHDASNFQEKIQIDGSYIVNENVINHTLQSALIYAGGSAPHQFSIYFELQAANRVTFQCWNEIPDSVTSEKTAQSINGNPPENIKLAPIMGGVTGGIVVLVIIGVIAVFGVKTHRKKAMASKQQLKQTLDSYYHYVPDLQVASGTATTQMVKGVHNPNFNKAEAYEELPDIGQNNNTGNSLKHHRHCTSLQQDQKPNQNQKKSFLTQVKTSSDKSSNEMPEYAKVNKKKNKPTCFELESGDTPAKTPVYAKVKKGKMEPTYYELEPQDGINTSSNEQHHHFELESCDAQIRAPQINPEVETDHTHFELESGSEGGDVHLKLGDNDYAYTYAHFNRDPSEKSTQKHDDNNDDDDKVEFTDNDIYNTNKMEITDNDV